MAIAILSSQSATEVTAAPATGDTLDFPATATINNLLVVSVAWVNLTTDSDAATLTITGWTEAIQQGRSGNGENQMNGTAIFFKISDGTETDVTTILTAARKHGMQFTEFSGVDGTPLDKTNSFDQSSLVNAVKPGATGVLSQADEVMIFAVGWGDDGWTADSFDLSFIEINPLLQLAGSNTDVSLAMGHLIVSATTSLDPEHSVTGTAEDAIACIATFKGTVGTVPVINLVMAPYIPT